MGWHYPTGLSMADKVNNPTAYRNATYKRHIAIRAHNTMAENRNRLMMTNGLIAMQHATRHNSSSSKILLHPCPTEYKLGYKLNSTGKTTVTPY